MSDVTAVATNVWDVLPFLRIVTMNLSRLLICFITHRFTQNHRHRGSLFLAHFKPGEFDSQRFLGRYQDSQEAHQESSGPKLKKSWEQKRT